MAGKKKASGVHLSWPRPIFTQCVKSYKQFMSVYRQALTYAHYELSSTDLKKETQKYFKSLDAKHPLLEKIAGLHENRFLVVGKYLYIINHGGELPEGILSSVMTNLNEIIDNYTGAKVEEKVVEVKEEGNTITIQDRLRDKACVVAGDIEGWIDDFFMDKKMPVKTVDDFVALFKANDLKGPHMRHVIACFEKRTLEIAAAMEGDKDILEGYSNLNKIELKKYNQFLQNLSTACSMMNQTAKVERAPRKKKPVALEKIVAKLKFKKDDNTLGIVSIAPTDILGAKELWVYNTKTRKLAHYKSSDADGFGVKGIGLLNYAAESAEKTLRKPIESLAEFKKASKVKLRTFMKELTTIDTPATGKFNEHCVLLRVDK